MRNIESAFISDKNTTVRFSPQGGSTGYRPRLPPYKKGQ